jgi:hypothetical protein
VEHENFEIRKEAHAQIIDIGLVEVLLAQAACRLVTKGIPDIHVYPWIS